MAIPGFHFGNEAGYFDTVGANVLDGRGTDRARNQHEVLQTAVVMGQRPVHEIIPLFPGFDPDPGAAVFLAAFLDAERNHRQHHSRPIAREQDIAAFAQDQQRPVLHHWIIEQFAQGLRATHIDQKVRARRHAKGVAAFQRGILDDGVAHPLGNCRVDVIALFVHVPARPGRARMAATASPIKAGPR